MELLHHGASAEAPLICLVDSPDHPFQLGELPAGFDAAVARFVVADWNAALTPWAAPGLYRGEPDFGGGAAKTLAALFDELAAFEDEQGLKPCSHAVAGYSLGGLFALWAFVTSERFAAVASLSGSTWYDGWLDWLTEQRVSGAGRFAYLSVGTKEKRAALARLRTVEDCVPVDVGDTPFCPRLVHTSVGPVCQWTLGILPFVHGWCKHPSVLCTNFATVLCTSFDGKASVV